VQIFRSSPLRVRIPRASRKWSPHLCLTLYHAALTLSSTGGWPRSGPAVLVMYLSWGSCPLGRKGSIRASPGAVKSPSRALCGLLYRAAHLPAPPHKTTGSIGSDLLSHPVTRAVPSALGSLTAGFGMEPGVPSPPIPPREPVCHHMPAPLRAAPLQLNRMQMPLPQTRCD
jgi:hypothetical protein